MSQAETLLNSLLQTPRSVSTSPINDVLVIDPEGRIVNIPTTEKLLGVEFDLNAERKYFKCPRFVGDNIDLTTLGLRVHYRNACGETDGYIIDDVEVSGDFITFSWKLGGSLFRSKGTIHFAICAVSVDTDGYKTCKWNTTLASGNVLEGLYVDLTASEEIEARDILQELLSLLNTRSDEAVQAVTDEGVKQIANIESAGSGQISLIESKGAETLAAILGNITVYKFTVTLKADSWIASNDGTYYTQDTGITVGENNKVDLQPTAEQLVELLNNGISMFLANESGSLSAYAIGDIPDFDMTIQATEMEVVYV